MGSSAAMLPADLRELVLPLLDGARDNPPWALLVRNVALRTRAATAVLALDGPGRVRTVVAASSGGAAALAAFERAAAGAALRAGRVYALDELLDHSVAARTASQRAALAAAGVRHARVLRVAADGWTATLVLTHPREDFEGAAVATLALIEPLLAPALRTFALLQAERLRAVVAEDGLARLGAAQIAFDAEGRVLAAGAAAQRLLPFAADPGPPRRLALPGPAADALGAACARLAADPAAAPEIVALDRRGDRTLLLYPASLAGVAATGAVRTAARSVDPGVLRALHGLSAREAALASALAAGESLGEAGARLGLTRETARNYSKRIFAKTGAAGQPDLVRAILTGVAPFA
ncbi:MAG: LuxR family transcriptional regulator [Alphaproteobacteria bacterium]|nr:LuxR family transcriptional regulator [Alphaproteobacteria bacterium]